MSSGNRRSGWRISRRGLLLVACMVVLLQAAGAQQLNGAGASFPNPIYSRWFAEYGASHGGARINYQPAGSGAGIRQASEGIVDFGATDMPMTNQQMGAARVKLFHIPTVLGAVVPIYNLPGVNTELKLTGSMIADIYLGKIAYWNDRQIAAANPGVPLPSHMILPVYRSDGSGTTAIFNRFPIEDLAGFCSACRQEHLSAVEDRHRSKGQRRCRGHGAPDAVFVRLRRTCLRAE